MWMARTLEIMFGILSNVGSFDKTRHLVLQEPLFVPLALQKVLFTMHDIALLLEWDVSTAISSYSCRFYSTTQRCRRWQLACPFFVSRCAYTSRSPAGKYTECDTAIIWNRPYVCSKRCDTTLLIFKQLFAIWDQTDYVTLLSSAYWWVENKKIELSKLPGKARWHAAQTSTTRDSRQTVRQDGERNVIREMKEANSFSIH